VPSNNGDVVHSVSDLSVIDVDRTQFHNFKYSS
jgi:hypothetical protein